MSGVSPKATTMSSTGFSSAARALRSACAVRALGLHVDFRARNECRRLARDTLPLGTDHDRRPRGSRPGYGREHVPDHRAARDLVQHLGTRRLHARPFPRG